METGPLGLVFFYWIYILINILIFNYSWPGLFCPGFFLNFSIVLDIISLTHSNYPSNNLFLNNS